MKKAVFVLGSLELDAVRQGRPLTHRTLHILSELADSSRLDADIVFAMQDEYFAGRDKSKIGITRIREERPRVLDEIIQAKPDLIICFGPVAAASVFGKGNLTEDGLLRQKHYPLGDQLPVHYTFSLENLRRSPGLRQWLDMDIKAAINGWTETEWGKYTTLLPDDPAWNVLPTELQNAKVVGLDTETYPGLDYYHADARIRMCQISACEGRSFVVQCTPDSRVPDWLTEILESSDVTKVGSNIKYDYKWLRRFGIRTENIDDTSTREHIIDQSNPKKDLKSLTFKYLPRLGDYSRPHRQLVSSRGGWELVEDDEQYEYAAADAEASIATWVGQEPQLAAFQNPHKLFKELYQVLAEVEFNGICVDLSANRALDSDYKSHLRVLRQDISVDLGPVNLNSPTQLSRALMKLVPDIDLSFNDLRRAMSTEETEELSTKRDVLEREAHKHPVILKVLEFRKYRVRHSTFIDKVHEKHLIKHHGCTFLHPSYRTDLVETYRTSSQSPNTQNIPRDDKDNPHLSVKRQFISRWDGGYVLEIDQSQIELRFAAWASQDAAMIEVLESGEDIHRSMAARFLGKEPGEITDEERGSSKTLTFLILYGGGAKKLGLSLGITTAKAKKLIKDYFAAFPQLKKFIDDTHAIVKRDLEITTAFGFRRRFSHPGNWRSSEGFSVQRKAFNTLIQNGAACLTYCAMIEVHNALESRNLQSKMVLQVHDSILIDVHPDELEEVKKIAVYGMEIACIKKAREFNVDFTIPLKADVKVGINWAEVESA